MSQNKFNCICGSIINENSKNRHFKTKKHIKYEEEQKNKKPKIKDEQRSENKKIYKMLKTFYYGFMLRSNKVFCQKKAFIITEEDENQMIDKYYNYYNKEDTKYKPIKKFFKKFQKIFRKYLDEPFIETPDLEHDFYLLNLEVSGILEEARKKLKNKEQFNINDLINDSEEILKASESPKFFKKLEERRDAKKGKGIITFKELQKKDPKKAEELWNSILPQIEDLIKTNNIKF